MKAALSRLWPRSLTGRLFLAVAITLLVTQSFNAILLYRSQSEQRAAMLTNAMAVRMIRATDRQNERRNLRRPGGPGERFGGRGRRRRLEFTSANPVNKDWQRLPEIEARLGTLLASYNMRPSKVVVALDPRPQILPIDRLLTPDGQAADRIIVGAIKLEAGQWLSIRFPEPPGRRGVRGWLIFQTVTLTLILLGVIFYITRTLSRPLQRLNSAVADFSHSQQIVRLPEDGPQDVAELTRNFNIMAQRIGTMLDEKDIMLGAIGHDLKTPLSALRVRVESVESETLRGKMVASIEDLHRSLDEILLLARVGRGQEERESVNLGALLDTIVEEFTALDKPVTLDAPQRVVGAVYASWFRRALRNLIGNAVRYGHCARVHIAQEDALVTIHVDDDGPGIPEDELEKIFTPFYRLEKSRNSQTGGAGLGLTLARAIAEKHGGTIALTNRYAPDGAISGLRAIFAFPREPER